MARLFDVLLKFAVGIPFFYFLRYTLGDEGKRTEIINKDIKNHYLFPVVMVMVLNSKSSTQRLFSSADIFKQLLIIKSKKSPNE